MKIYDLNSVMVEINSQGNMKILNNNNKNNKTVMKKIKS